MRGSNPPTARSARVIVAACWGTVCLCVIAAPALALCSHFPAASVLYALFSRVCHQMPERSFQLFGHSLAVCHRCSGIYAGMFLGCFLHIRPMHRDANTRRFWLAAALLLTALDALAPIAGLWTSAALSRFSTGLLLGTLISVLVVRGVSEWVQETPWRRFAAYFPQLKGDVS